MDSQQLQRHINANPMLSNMFQSSEPSKDEVEEMLDPIALMENAKLTYDVYIQNNLEATSHSLQWLPFSKVDPTYSLFNQEHFLMGTHYDDPEDSQASSKEDSLYVMSVRVPVISKTQKSVIDYSKLTQDWSKQQVVKRFDHQGEVSKARAMKQDYSIIASIINTGEVHMYKWDESDDSCAPKSKLQGLDQEGFGLSWSPQEKGLLGGASGKQICLWNVQNEKPIAKIDDAHLKTINDLKFSNLNPNIFGTASDDSHYKIWDKRTMQFSHCYKASEDDLSVISFNHIDEFLFSTGGEQSGVVHIWDLRMNKGFINDLYFHKQQVNQIEWSPMSVDIFMTSSNDGKLFIWDNSKTGEEQARHDFEDGPVEMIFPHDRHEANIEDICWSPIVPNLVASCDTNLVFQVWKMSEDFLFDNIDYSERLHLIRDQDLE